MSFRLEFTGNDVYKSGAPRYLGEEFGTEEAVSYEIEDGFVIITFTGWVTRRIPVHRLLEITEKP